MVAAGADYGLFILSLAGPTNFSCLLLPFTLSDSLRVRSLRLSKKMLIILSKIVCILTRSKPALGFSADDFRQLEYNSLL